MNIPSPAPSRNSSTNTEWKGGGRVGTVVIKGEGTSGKRERKRKKIHGWMRLRPLILFVWNRCANERKRRKEERKKEHWDVGSL